MEQNCRDIGMIMLYKLTFAGFDPNLSELDLNAIERIMLGAPLPECPSRRDCASREGENQRERARNHPGSPLSGLSARNRRWEGQGMPLLGSIFNSDVPAENSAPPPVGMTAAGENSSGKQK